MHRNVLRRASFLVGINRHVVIHAPTEGTLIDDHPVYGANHLKTAPVLAGRSHFSVTRPGSQSAYDYVVSLYGETAAFQADTVSRCGLGGEGEVAVREFNGLLQFDDPPGSEKDDAGGGHGFAGPTQGALSRFAGIVREGIHKDNFSSPATRCGGPESLRSRKRWRFRFRLN